MTRDRFILFADTLRELGFKVYLNKEASYGDNYAVFTDGTRIGKMRQAPYNENGVMFGTVHKPCREYGSGFAVNGEYNPTTLEELTREQAEKAFAVVPEGFPRTINRRVIVKYRDFEEWKRKDIHSDLYEYGE